MRRLPLALRRALPFALLSLPACGPEPEPAADPGAGAGPTTGAFDVPRWVAAARALGADTTADALSYDVLRESGIKALADSLDDAVGWRRACNTFWDADSSREVYRAPTVHDDAHGARGLFALHALGDGAYLADVVCDFGAYQGAYVLVLLDGPRATILRGQTHELSGEPFGPPSPHFSTVGVDGEAESGASGPAARTFTTFARLRGLGDCGVLTRYRVGAGPDVETVEVRARGCDDEPSDTPPDPEDWPVVYPRE